MTKAPTLLPYTGNNLVPILAARGKLAVQAPVPIQPIPTKHVLVAAMAKPNKLVGVMTTMKTMPSNNTRKIAEAKPVVAAVAKKKPVDLLRSIIHSSREESSNSNFDASHKKIVSFEKPSEDDIQAYDLETVKAIRTNNVDLLRKLWSNGDGKSMNACNQFGESVLHMACRRGFSKIVDFLLREVRVRSDRCDDFGRNPFHDALWTSSPNFDVVDALIRYADPLLMLSEDVRGNTPFAYARYDHNERWITFLVERKHIIIERIGGSTATATTALTNTKHITATTVVDNTNNNMATITEINEKGIKHSDLGQQLQVVA